MASIVTAAFTVAAGSVARVGNGVSGEGKAEVKLGITSAVADGTGEGTMIVRCPSQELSKTVNNTVKITLDFTAGPSNQSLLLRSHPLVATLVLRLIESTVGAGEERLPVFLLDPILSGAEADRHRDLLLARFDMQGTGVLAQSFRLLSSGFYRAMRQDDQKFIAAVAADRIGITDVIPHLTGQPAQHIVANCMTVRIVDLFEVIDIQHGNGQRRAITVLERDFALQISDDLFAIGEEGQGIGMRDFIGLRDHCL